MLISPSRVHAVTLANSFPPRKAGLELIASLVAYRHAAEEHFEDFVFILRSIAQVPSLSKALPSSALLNDARLNEEEVVNPEADTDRAPMEQANFLRTGPVFS